jgi:hypothetical protein
MFFSITERKLFKKGKEMKRKIMILCLLWFEGRSFFFAPLSIAKKIYKP